MNYIELSNDIRIPQLGLGVWQTENGRQTEDAVRCGKYNAPLCWRGPEVHTA